MSFVIGYFATFKRDCLHESQASSEELGLRKMASVAQASDQLSPVRALSKVKNGVAAGLALITNHHDGNPHYLYSESVQQLCTFTLYYGHILQPSDSFVGVCVFFFSNLQGH